LSIKKSEVRGEVAQFGHLTDKGSSSRPHFLVQKTSDFMKILLCPHDGQGVRSIEIVTTVGCFIFSPFLKFNMPGVLSDRVLDKN